MKKKCIYCQRHKPTSEFVRDTFECKLCKKKDIRKLVGPRITSIRKAHAKGKLPIDYFWKAPATE